MSKSPVWCLQRHQKFILVQFPDSGEEDQHPGDEEHSGEKEQPRMEQETKEEDLLPALCTEEEQTKAEEPG